MGDLYGAGRRVGSFLPDSVCGAVYTEKRSKEILKEEGVDLGNVENLLV